MAAGDLTTVEKLKTWAGFSPGMDDELVGSLIAAASSQIQSWLGYKVARDTYTRIFNGRGSDRLFVPDWPLVAVSSVNVDGVAMAAAIGPTGYGYVFDDKAIYLRGARFARGTLNIVLTYTAGYAADTIPVALEHACLDLAAGLNANRERDPGVTSRRAGDTAEVYGGNVTEFGSQTILLPPSIVAMLQPFRRMVTP